jgi:hypothetical protein
MMSKQKARAALLLLLACACGDDALSLGDAAAGFCASDDDCDDGLVCSGEERCEEGACRPGAPPTCHDEDPCTRDVCLEPLGCDYVPICELPIDEMDGGRMPGLDTELDARVQELDAAGPQLDAEVMAEDAAIAIPDAGIAACVGPHHVGDVFATDPSTLEQLEGVQCLIGSLTVRGNRIEDLSALRALRVVSGSVTILRTPLIERLTDLDGLEHVGVELIVDQLPGRAEMDLFPSLRFAQSVWITSIVKVQRLGGFDDLEQANSIRFTNMHQLRFIAGSDGGPVAERIEQTGELSLQLLPQLEAVAGFGALRSIGSVTLNGVGAVALGDAFEQLRELSSLWMNATQMTEWTLPRLELAGSLTFSQNPELLAIELDALHTADSVSVWSNPALTRVAMPGLTQLRWLALTTNAALAELRFDALQEIYEDLTVTSNAVLSACAVEALLVVTPSTALRRSTCCGAACAVCESCLVDGGVDAGL